MTNYCEICGCDLSAAINDSDPNASRCSVCGGPKRGASMNENDRFLIWSNEHDAWWRPGSQGYTTVLQEAGEYTFEQASYLCKNADYGRGRNYQPQETMIPVSAITHWG